MHAGTRVKILMKSNLHFNGVVISENQHFLEIKDKFNRYVSIGKSEIALLEVQE